MAHPFDTSLGNIRNRRGGGERGRGWGRGVHRGHGGMFRERAVGMSRGPLRASVRPAPYKIAKSFSRARDMIWKHDLFNDSMAAAGLAVTESGTKLYISNLDYGVSNEDIKELFAEFGELKGSMVHYDRNGRPNGSAEVVFVRRSGALAALKKYNNVQLDGKAMKIEIIGDSTTSLPVSARINVGRSNGAERRTVSIVPKPGQVGGGQFSHVARVNRGGFQGRRGALQANCGGAQSSRGGFKTSRGGFQATRGRERGRGRGRGRGRKQAANKSAAELDKELENYHAGAMDTS